MWDMFLGDGPYVPLADGTREDCWESFWWRGTLAGSAISCLNAALAQELDLDRFLLWNPNLDQNLTAQGSLTYDFPCTISSDASYRMQLASPTPMPEEALPPIASSRWQDCKWHRLVHGIV